jgi:hypothetical protein
MPSQRRSSRRHCRSVNGGRGLVCSDLHTRTSTCTYVYPHTRSQVWARLVTEINRLLAGYGWLDTTRRLGHSGLSQPATEGLGHIDSRSRSLHHIRPADELGV